MQCYIFYHGMDFVTKLLDPKSYIWSQCYFPTTNEKFLGTRVHPTRVHLITLILTAQAVLTTLRIRELDSKQKQGIPPPPHNFHSGSEIRRGKAVGM